MLRSRVASGAVVSRSRHRRSAGSFRPNALAAGLSEQPRAVQDDAALGRSPHEDWIERAVQRACESARSGGGPFGAVVARGGEMLGEGSNRVTLDRDPTAHAEVIAIRAACAKLGTH